jgi:hypothetical protein
MHLLTDSLASFAAIFRAVLLLIGEVPPIKKHAIVRETIRALDLRSIAFERIFDIREKHETEGLNETDLNDLFAEYLEQIERVIDRVNEIEG